MSLDSVRTHLATHAPDLAILEAETSTATVALAAAAHGVSPGQIAKTLAFWMKEEPILVVMSGDARIDNQKFKAHFGSKAKMLDGDAVLQWTSHPVGGVCPFGLPQPLRIYADVSLRQYDEVVPAAGSTTSALRIAPARLTTLVEAQWIDVGQAPTPRD
jgi:prolyl-tRNA editing enzyme YbaK/EbsC (Cys-tRNA(Pro) deacylase)